MEDTKTHNTGGAMKMCKIGHVTKVILLLLTTFFISLFFSKGIAYAYISGLLDIEQITQQSDVVCTGEGMTTLDWAILENSHKNKTNIEVMYRVEKVLKGDVLSDAKIKIILPPYADMEPWDAPFKNEYCIIFLKKNNGSYVFTDIMHAKLLISKKYNKTFNGNIDSPQKAVILELVNSIYDTDTQTAQKAVIYLMEGVGQMGQQAPPDYLIPYLKEFAKPTSTVSSMRGIALGMLLTAKQYSYMDEISEYLKDLPSEPDLGRGFIARALSKIRDPEMIPMLNDLLLNSKDWNVRLHVAQNLREIRDKSSIPYFIKGLDDENQEVRHRCMIAIYEVETNFNRKGKNVNPNDVNKFGGYIPTVEVLEANETEYLNKWKKWWGEEGKIKYSKEVKAMEKQQNKENNK